MSAPFLVPLTGNSWIRSTARSTSWRRYDELAGTDQSAYARANATVPNDEA